MDEERNLQQTNVVVVCYCRDYILVAMHSRCNSWNLCECLVLDYLHSLYWILGCSVKEECFVKTFDAIKNFKSGKIITIGSLIILLILSYPTMLTKNSLLSSKFEDILVFLITMSFWVFTIGVSDYLTAPKANMGMVIYGGHGLFTSFLTNFLYIYNEQLKVILYRLYYILLQCLQ